MTDFLSNILSGIYGIVGNYGWAIVLFTILIRVLLLPLDIKNRKGMRKMQQIQPELNKLQQKYANDKVKLQQKQSELMRKEKYSPLSGCLPLLIQMPILFAMFAAMRQISSQQTVEHVFTFLNGEAPVYEGWLWVKNLWMADSLFASIAPNLATLQVVGANVWESVWAALADPAKQTILANITAHVPEFSGALNFTSAEALKASMPFIQNALSAMPAYQAALQTMPGWTNLNFVLFNISVFLQYNGLLILPILAGLTQLLMTKFTPGMAQPAAGAGATGQQAGMGNFMKYFFPIFSVYICLTSNAGFALYWVTSNLIASASNVGISAYFDRKDHEKIQLIGENTVR